MLEAIVIGVLILAILLTVTPIVLLLRQLWGLWQASKD